MAGIWDFLDSLPKRGDVTPEELARRRQGYADLYQGGLLARNRDQAPLSVRGAQATQDFMPVIGDLVALGEAGDAFSRGELAAAGLLGAGAAIGLVPGAGDALAKPVMAAGRKLADAIPSDALYAGRSLAEGDTRGVLDAFTPSRPAQGLGADAVGRSGSDIVDLGTVRADRDRADFIDKIKGVIADVQSGGYQQRLDDAGSALHRDGAMPLPTGTKVQPPRSWDMPGDWSVDGYWMDAQNPSKYGYNLKNADGEVYQAVVSDPQIGYRMDDPNKFGGGFTAYTGPRGNALEYAERSSPVKPIAAPMSLEDSARMNAEYDDLFGDYNGTPSPAQEVAGLLSSGRANEVTDEMLAKFTPNDEKEMFDLYQRGATGMDLPMDEASRMARAAEAGFTTGRDRQDVMRELRGLDNPQLVHYTNQDFSEFRIPERQNRQAIWATPDPSVNLATKDNFQDFSDEGVVGIPVMGRMTKRVSPYEFRMAGDPMTPGFPRNVTAEDVAKAKAVGADYAEAGLEYAIFDPTNIRSRFARFDPRLAHLRNLSAGVGGLGLLSSVMPPEEQY